MEIPGYPPRFRHLDIYFWSSMGFLREVLILDIRVEFITEMSVYVLWGKSAQGYPKFEVPVEIRQISHFLWGTEDTYKLREQSH